MGKWKRKELSFEDKFEVVKQLEKNVKQTEISKRLGCSQAQISRISSKRDEIRKFLESNLNPKCKRKRYGKDAAVENALAEWFKNAKMQDLPISGPVLIEKAKVFAAEMGKPDFNPTTGWLERWKHRNNFDYKTLYRTKNSEETLNVFSSGEEVHSAEKKNSKETHPVVSRGKEVHSSEKNNCEETHAAFSSDEEVHEAVKPAISQILSALKIIRKGLEFCNVSDYSHYNAIEDQLMEVFSETCIQNINVEIVPDEFET